jgi:hypothetical protein
MKTEEFRSRCAPSWFDAEIFEKISWGEHLVVPHIAENNKLGVLRMPHLS